MDKRAHLEQTPLRKEEDIIDVFNLILMNKIIINLRIA